ncbi:MAG: LD-carboxypeptidase [Alphaproteobacteria bacterium]|nr:LD-carboxypeptidase [Alphaproteobacteria bacterium]
MSRSRQIAVVAPASPVKKEIAERVEALAASIPGGPRVRFHPQCFSTEGHFAGSDAERSAALLEVANDPAVDAVWFGRGGYGSGRLDETLFGALNDAARRKTYLGYSDLGFVLARLLATGVGKPVHGPMPSDIARPGGEDAVRRALSFLADGDLAGIEPTARAGRNVVAFNLTILAHLIGASWAPDLSGCVIMLEETCEHHYRIDRCFFTLFQNPGVRKAAGIMLGRCSDIPENDPIFGKSEEEIARYWCDRYGVPYLGRADIGHDAGNKIVPFGGVQVADAAFAS